MTFPQPIKFSHAVTRWKRSDIVAYECRAAGIPDTSESVDEGFFSDRDLAARYQVSRNTIWRWARESDRGAA